MFLEETAETEDQDFPGRDSGKKKGAFSEQKSETERNSAGRCERNEIQEEENAAGRSNQKNRL